MLQLFDLCRLCAQKKRNKLNLFTGLNDEKDKILLAKISLCLSLQVTREDLLPKMICNDCQRAVEQFSAFRVKCQKAEERLNKMLSLALPNKLTVTRIKQECLESDNNDNLNLDLPTYEPVSFVNLKSLKNIKCEVDESGNEVDWSENNSTDLIQIISEEIVNQQDLIDIKQPQIEIISEDFSEEFKNVEEIEKNFVCDIKVIPENVLRIENEIDDQCLEINFQSEDVVVKATDSDQELATVKKIKNKRKAVNKYKENKNEYEVDEKYLTLREGETCNIDFEEVDALIKKKQDPNVLFSCDKCEKSFKFFKCLKKHKQWHDSQPNVFICELCKVNSKSFEFCSLKSLNNHIQRKHFPSNKNQYECSLCKKILPSKGQLNAHHKKVHDTSGAHCSVCKKVFKNKARLKSHLKVHQEERPYVCDQCGQSFKWSNALKVHIQWHKQEKNFLCSECGKKFTAKKNLIEHLNIHTGKRPFVCKDCNASFVQFSAYSKHLFLHNDGRRIHKCEKCGKNYSHAYLLKQHLIRHTGLRPYECSICQRSFKSQSDLCCHVKIHQEKQFECQVCGRKFALSKTLKDHMVRHTGVKHRCPVPDCSKTYTQRFSLTKHFCKQHPSLTIVKKKSGKRSHYFDKNGEKEGAEVDFIHYDFTEKESGANFGFT